MNNNMQSRLLRFSIATGSFIVTLMAAFFVAFILMMVLGYSSDEAAAHKWFGLVTYIAAIVLFPVVAYRLSRLKVNLSGADILIASGIMIAFNVSALNSTFLALVATAALIFLCFLFYITYRYARRNLAVR